MSIKPLITYVPQTDIKAALAQARESVPGFAEGFSSGEHDFHLRSVRPSSRAAAERQAELIVQNHAHTLKPGKVELLLVIPDEKVEERVETFTRSFTLGFDDHASHYAGDSLSEHVLFGQANSWLKKRAEGEGEGARITTVRLIENKHVDQTLIDDTDSAPQTLYYVVEKGTMDILYPTFPQITGRGGYTDEHDRPGYDTIEEATRVMQEELAEPQPWDMEVVGLTRRADGSGLKVGQTRRTHTMTIEATISRPLVNIYSYSKQQHCGFVLCGLPEDTAA